MFLFLVLLGSEVLSNRFSKNNIHLMKLFSCSSQSFLNLIEDLAKNVSKI